MIFKIESLVKGLGNGKVSKAYPGDVVEAVRARKIFVAVRVLEPGPYRTEAKCKHFWVCGGCRWQGMRYDAQLEFKQREVEKFFGKTEEIIGAERIWHYRNKIELTFLQELGYRYDGRWDKTFKLENCLTAYENFMKIVKKAQEWWSEVKLPSYDFLKREGILRYLVIRGNRKGESLAVLVVTKEVSFSFGADGEFLAINKSPSDVARGELKHVRGKTFLEEKILGKNFIFGPFSFLQPHLWQAEKIYKIILDYVNGATLDAYSGIGVIAGLASENATKIFALESEKENLKFLKLNVPDAKIIEGKFENVSIPEVDTLIVDPPRPGLHPKAIRKIVEIKPKRIIYLSCNPETQARDINRLKDYEIELVQPIDMLPHTPHVENLVVLKRK